MKFIKRILPLMIAPLILTNCGGSNDTNDKQENENSTILNKTNFDDALSYVENLVNEEKIKGNNATASLNEDIVLPLFESSKWELEFKGLTLDKGHVLTYGQDTKNSKIYMTFNKTNKVFVLGICNNRKDNKFYNYCFDLKVDTLENKNCSLVFEDQEFIFKMDDQEFELNKFNVNQQNQVGVSSIETLNQELKKQITAIIGSEHLIFNGIGSLTDENHTFSGEFEEINAKVTFDKNLEKPVQENVLDDKSIFVLGSSIFYGHGSNGFAFSDLIKDHNLSTEVYKETVSGTTLAIKPNLKNSYIDRMEQKIASTGKHKYIEDDDVLIVQLSTNDFSTGVPHGSLTSDEIKNSDAFDKSTITGAIEYIIARAREINPQIEIVFMSCPIIGGWGAKSVYKQYNDTTMQKIVEKWGIHLLDVFNYKAAVSIYYRNDGSATNGYFADDIHPNSLGYSCIIYPLMDNLLREIFSK